MRETPGVIRSTYGGRGKLPTSHAIARPEPLGPEHNPWFWHPNRVGALAAPAWFMDKVQAIAGELSVNWNPTTERWQVWLRAPRVNHPFCQGWRLLFVHHDQNRDYMPLDERLLARLHLIDATKNGGTREYFDRIVAEYERDQAARERRLKQEAIDQAMPFWEHSRIKNIGSGSKFSDYHS